MTILVDFPAIDYLRLSARGDDYTLLEGHFDGLEGQAEHKQIMQYMGQKKGGVFWGRAFMHGELWGLLDVPGYEADTQIKHLRDCETGVDCRCTRVDYQLTLLEPPKYDAFAFRKSLKDCTSRDVGIIGVEKDGMTVTIGKRKTGHFIRIYQKFIKTKYEAEWYLRFEVEYTHEMSRNCWKGNVLNACGIIRGEIEAIKATGYCKEILDPFNEVVKNHDKYHVRRIKPIPASAKWLDESVLPCVLRMLNSHDQDEHDFAEMWINLVYERLRQYKEG